MIFNPENTGHTGNNIPLFLGSALGVMDTINVQYPELEEFYQLQVSQIWNEFEVDITQDRLDMMQLPKETTDLMVKTIMWQYVADSVASRSIIETLGAHVTNSEMGNLAQLWSFFEVIHGRTYSHIVKQTFAQPNEMLEQLYSEAAVLQRSDIIVQTFEDMSHISPDTHSTLEIKQAILKTLCALCALESIAFMGSFAVTFALVETGKFVGIGQLVKLICRDEVLHSRMGMSVLKILKEDPEWKTAWDKASFDIEDILVDVVEQELKWADYLFSENRQVNGLNAVMLKEYTIYMSRPLFNRMDIPFPYEVIKSNPLPYMDKYVDSQKVQAAAQEVQLTNYKVGAIIDDTEGLDLTDMKDIHA